MHVPTVFPHFLTSSLFLEFGFDHILEFHSIHSELSDSLCQLFRRHLIFIQKPAEFLLVQRNFLNVKFCSCKNVQNVLLVHSEISLFGNIWPKWHIKETMCSKIIIVNTPKVDQFMLRNYGLCKKISPKSLKKS